MADKNQVITVELPNGKVLTYPSSMPIEQIQADAKAKMDALPPVGFKEGLRPDLGTHMGENIGPGLTGAALTSILSPMISGLLGKIGAGAGAGGMMTPAGKGALEAEKRVFGAAPQGAYSSNVSTGATADDIKEMLTGSSHGIGSPDGTPMMFQDPALRRSIDALKRKTSGGTPGLVRRKPK